MSSKHDFEAVFNDLKRILRRYEPEMDVKADSDANYYLDTFKMSQFNKKPVFFASAQIKKNYASYYLMPVYAFPVLLEGISGELRQRMQGKSCFNFKETDAVLVAELERLTELGYNKYKEEQWI
ncbi:hypothetical protein [Paenibacillus alkalitolerans]|uniref:hypothetical protein n=1 Tax=Paenibacillus alkalitolerans TaxID=2799335 RepID=UPI0018F60342|nr:hypothetical protein [Paenibacillus alkalitolerans]